MPGAYSITASFKGFRDIQVLVRVLVATQPPKISSCK